MLHNLLLAQIEHVRSEPFELRIQQRFIIVERFSDLTQATQLVDINLGQVGIIFDCDLTQLRIKQLILLFEITNALNVGGESIVEIL